MKSVLSCAFAALIMCAASCSGGIPEPDSSVPDSGDAAFSEDSDADGSLPDETAAVDAEPTEDPGQDSTAEDSDVVQSVDIWEGRPVSDFPLPALPEGNFAAPEGILVHGDRVFVVNANFAYQESSLVFGAGFITVVDRQSMVVVNRIPLPFRNPQELAVDGNRLWVLCSGETAFDGRKVVSRTSGGLVAVNLVGVDSAAGPDGVIPLETQEGSVVGYPSGLFVAGRTMWMSSGTTAALFRADMDRGIVINGADSPVPLDDISLQNTTVLGPGPAGLMTAALFNSDTVMLLDPESGAVVDKPWGMSGIGQEGQLDGILDMEVVDGRIAVLLGMANMVVSFDAAKGPAAGVHRVFGNVLTPNRIKAIDGLVFATVSGGNALASCNIDGSGFSSAGLPAGCNPWDLEVVRSAEGIETWVTCLKTASVVKASADGGKMDVLK